MKHVGVKWKGIMQLHPEGQGIERILSDALTMK
jgi:hypothetical protein